VLYPTELRAQVTLIKALTKTRSETQNRNDNLDDNPKLWQAVVVPRIICPRRLSTMPATTPPRKQPRKPYPTFPLTAHPNGQWCKKIRGKVHFFGVWGDPETPL
jgi:hypothetical protein